MAAEGVHRDVHGLYFCDRHSLLPHITASDLFGFEAHVAGIGDDVACPSGWRGTAQLRVGIIIAEAVGRSDDETRGDNEARAENFSPSWNVINQGWLFAGVVAVPFRIH